MTQEEVTKEKLTQFPAFRERRFRASFLLKLALREMGIEAKYFSGISLSVKEMVEFAKKYDSMRHAWDKVMEENENLHGKDYKDKRAVEEEWQISHGYESGFHQVNKLLSTIS